MEPDKSDKNEHMQTNFSNNNVFMGALSYEIMNKERESTKLAKQRFLDAFNSHIGGLSVSKAAEMAGISRDTYYRWRHDDKEFEDKIKYSRSCFNDVVEDLLFEKIQEKDTACIKYYLDHHHPDYKKKPECQLRAEYYQSPLNSLISANQNGLNDF